MFVCTLLKHHILHVREMEIVCRSMTPNWLPAPYQAVEDCYSNCQSLPYYIYVVWELKVPRIS